MNPASPGLLIGCFGGCAGLGLRILLQLQRVMHPAVKAGCMVLKTGCCGRFLRKSRLLLSAVRVQKNAFHGRRRGDQPRLRNLKNSRARPPHAHRTAKPSRRGPALTSAFLPAGASVDAEAAGLGLGEGEGCSVGEADGTAVGVLPGVAEGRAGRITALLGGMVASGAGVAGAEVATGG